MNKGSLVISLDFEMMWGVIDVHTTDTYGQTNVKNVELAIDRMLDLFKKYDVKATFATVGMIMHKDTDELKSVAPAVRPSYDNLVLSPYRTDYVDGVVSKIEYLFFAPDIIEKLKTSDVVEIGTHTYCHYYCWENGQTLEQFEEDIKTAVKVASKNGIELKSIIFPRNQVSKEYLDVCAKYGITSYRGNAKKFFNKPQNKIEQYKNKICRTLDAYINIGGHSSYPSSEIDAKEKPLNIKASRFFKPYNTKLSFLECLRISRIKREMEYAAQHNEIYHLWWHPHNFGASMDENLRNLESVLICYKQCCEKYGMKSYTMNELYDEIVR